MAMNNDTMNASDSPSCLDEKIIIIDAVDSDLLSMRWGPNNKNYLIRKDNGKNYLIHRVIMERVLGRPLTKDERVDHRDTNPFNNSRSNLRLATNAQNAQNSNRQSTSQSPYKGLGKTKSGWIARIRVDGESKYLGHFSSAEDAARAYNEAALHYFKEYARLNVIASDLSVVDDNDLQPSNDVIRVSLEDHRTQTPQKSRVGRGRVGASGFKGVTWNRSNNNWTAQFVAKKQHTYLGSFSNVHDAARAYNQAALEHYGECAILNIIPDDTPSLMGGAE